MLGTILSIILGSLIGCVLGSLAFYLISLPYRTKLYREVDCKFCHGQGQHLFNMIPEGIGRYLGSKLCKACNGKGTQTVLERIE